MSKFTIKDLWNERYGNQNEVYDYAGRLMMKSACGNPHSAFQPTIDHIRPISGGGKDIKTNIVICRYDTNEEKADNFPHWKVDGVIYKAKKKTVNTSGYEIIKER